MELIKPIVPPTIISDRLKRYLQSVQTEDGKSYIDLLARDLPLFFQESKTFRRMIWNESRKNWYIDTVELRATNLEEVRGKAEEARESLKRLVG